MSRRPVFLRTPVSRMETKAAGLKTALVRVGITRNETGTEA